MDDHQAANADVRKKDRAAWVIKQVQLDAKALGGVLGKIFAEPGDLARGALPRPRASAMPTPPNASPICGAFWRHDERGENLRPTRVPISIGAITSSGSAASGMSGICRGDAHSRLSRPRLRSDREPPTWKRLRALGIPVSIGQRGGNPRRLSQVVVSFLGGEARKRRNSTRPERRGCRFGGAPKCWPS